MHDLLIGPQHAQEQFGWCWRHSFDFGTFYFFLLKSVMCADSIDISGGWPWNAMKKGVCRLDRIRLHGAPSVLSSVSRVFSALILTLDMVMRSCRNCWGCACHATADSVAQHCHISPLHLHIALHLLPGRYTQRTSRTNTSVSSLCTRIMLWLEKTTPPR